MTIGHAIVTTQAINAVLNDNGQPRKLPFKIKLRLTRVKEALEKEAQAYEEERVRLVNEYGEETEAPDGTKTIEVKDPEKIEKFYKDLEEVLKTEINPTYQRLSKEELKSIEELEIDITEPQIRAFFEYVVEKEAQ